MGWGAVNVKIRLPIILSDDYLSQRETKEQFVDKRVSAEWRLLLLPVMLAFPKPHS